MTDMTPRRARLTAAERATGREIAELLERRYNENAQPFAIMREVDQRWPKVPFVVALYGYALAVTRVQAMQECVGGTQ